MDSALSLEEEDEPIKTGEFPPNSNYEEDWAANWREHTELGTRISASHTGRQRAHLRQCTHRQRWVKKVGHYPAMQQAPLFVRTTRRRR